MSSIAMRKFRNLLIAGQINPLSLRFEEQHRRALHEVYAEGLESGDFEAPSRWFVFEQRYWQFRWRVKDAWDVFRGRARADRSHL